MATDPITQPLIVSPSILVLAVSVLGPVYGPWAAIVAMAGAGAVWPMYSSPTPTAWAAVKLLARLVITACAVTYSVGLAVHKLAGLPLEDTMEGIAFLAGAMGNHWVPLLESASKVLAQLPAMVVKDKGGEK